MFKNLSPEALGLSTSQNELIELALSFGFRGIELDVADFAAQAKEQGLPKARRLLDSAKLKIGCFSLPVRWEADDETFRSELARLPDVLGPAVEIGATRALTVVAPASDERPYHQNFEFHRERLGKVAQVLLTMGVQLGVGFSAEAARREGKAFEFIHSLDALTLLLGMLGAKNVGVWLDLWQLWASGGTLDLVRQKLKAEQIVAVSLSDVADPGDDPERQPAESRRLPGETGVIDSAAALTMLAELGYAGPVTPRPHSSQFAGMRRDDIVKLAGEKLDAVWKAAGLSPSGKLAASADR
ncbi:MAG TPA: TIM barrel protein [Pirellulales bacterium]|jgi:sugar phosphate isomerase/epimerase|nr:TIM barrel protein [Pirellulales bacterium]